jgi:hypothetical protein
MSVLYHFWNIRVYPFAVALHAVNTLGMRERHAKTFILGLALPTARWASVARDTNQKRFIEFRRDWLCRAIDFAIFAAILVLTLVTVTTMNLFLYHLKSL